MSNWPRTPDEILAVQKDRAKQEPQQSLDAMLTWEMFTAMWLIMRPIASDLAFVVKAMKWGIKGIGVLTILATFIGTTVAALHATGLI